MDIMSQPSRKLDQLTTTRFIAALSVVLFHGRYQLDILNRVPMLIAGPTAVGYFFVLSGFVMALAYYRPGIPFDFRSYWLARFSRIYPVYILAFALTCLYYLDILSKVKPPKVLANIFLYQAWIPAYALSFNIAAWSLSVEVFFYLLLPLLLIWATRSSAKQVIWFSLGFWVLSQLIHAFLTPRHMPMPGADSFLAYFPLFHLNSFLFGLAGGIWYLTYSSRFSISQIINRICLAAALGMVLLLLSLRGYLLAFPRTFSLDVGLLAPLFLAIILTLAWDTSHISRILSHPRLVTLGDASYALYILHIPISWLFQRLRVFTDITPEIMFLIYLPVTIALSIFVFKYIERPARTWLRTNPQTLTKILLDILLILAMIRFSFILRLGTWTSDFPRTQTFVLRVGVGIFFFALLAFRFYITHSWRSLALAILSGTATLSGFIYLAWTSGRVEVFPRSILILIPPLVFAAIYSSRLLFEFLKPKIQTESELS